MLLTVTYKLADAERAIVSEVIGNLADIQYLPELDDFRRRDSKPRGFSHTPRTHSLAQAGAYPDLPVLRLSNRRGYTSSRPRKSDRKTAIFACDDDV